MMNKMILQIENKINLQQKLMTSCVNKNENNSVNKINRSRYNATCRMLLCLLRFFATSPMQLISRASICDVVARLLVLLIYLYNIKQHRKKRKQ